MKQAVKAIWLKALRSGEYVQGEGYLCTASDTRLKHCCLGVLCDVLIPESRSKTTETIVRYDGAMYCLPASVEALAGLDEADPQIEIPGLEYKDNCGGMWYNKIKLSKLNDDGFTFSQIADLIEYFVEEEG